MGDSETTLDRSWEVPLQDLLNRLEANPSGLTSSDAKGRPCLHRPNSLVGESTFAALIGFLPFLSIPLS
jgi:hypothetical protein